MNRSIQSLGGVASGIIQRQNALNKYYENPTLCKQCLKIIEPRDSEKVSEVRRKNFCSQSCSAKFNNHRRIKLVVVIKRCGIRINLASVPFYKKPELFIKLNCRTKKDLFISRTNWQSARSSIRRNAQMAWKRSGRALKCSVCGYEKHCEIAHIKSVSDFSDESLIRDINSIDNLISLCPNHHWEFDNLTRDGVTAT